ncbi:hypothetical protein [Victivallis sp. Marseille-Q1083]|uniref:hypothetical protein n=1 Tax=Victivallis sp. Marseille-Q1083 TaxID=2717288 RepID=UPI00158AD1B5|nr:hypothetical protein [Victivallis sp. Marseille-Q1083]
MCEESICVGAVAEVKIGRHLVTVEVTEILEHGWRVRSQSSGKEFEVSRIDRIVSEPENPAPECRTPKKKLSLFEACIAYFRTQPRDRVLFPICCKSI